MFQEVVTADVPTHSHQVEAAVIADIVEGHLRLVLILVEAHTAVLLSLVLAEVVDHLEVLQEAEVVHL